MRSVCTKSCLLVVKWCETITAVIQLIGNIQARKCLELSSSAGRSDTVPRQQHLLHSCCHIQQGTKIRTFQRLRTWLHSKRKELTAHMFICKAASYWTSWAVQLFLNQKLFSAPKDTHKQVRWEYTHAPVKVQSDKRCVYLSRKELKLTANHKMAQNLFRECSFS